MDNVTHSLLGIAAAEPFAALHTRPKDRVKLWVASAVANNLPDLDVFFTYGHDRLTYLLHHRGYTHTVLLAPVQSLVWFAALRFWWRKDPDSPWRAIAALCLLGPLLHILADAWNSYGVHPFWPADNRWYYGDLIFIVEPWIWGILLPVIWRRCSSRTGKALALALMALMLGLAWYHPLVPWPVALTFTAVTLTWLAAQRFFIGNGIRIAAAWTALVAIFAAFGGAELSLKRAFAGEGSEIAALAAPGNPFCWTMLAAGFRGNDYRAAAWTAAPWPSLVPASACRPLLRSAASLGPLNEAPTPGRIALGAFHGTRADYEAITRSCRARAYLRFARLPIWRIEGKSFRLGDLRFDRGLSFAELSDADEPESCPRFEPPWLGRFYPSEISPAAP